MTEPRPPESGNGDAVTRTRILDQLASLSPEAAALLIDDAVATDLVLALASERRSEQRRAAEALAGVVPASPPLLKALRAALDAPDQRLRWGAAYTLSRGLPAEPELWPAARETLALDDGDQRWAAAELACAIARRHPVVLDEIRATLLADSATLRKMCLYCLRDLGVADAPRLACTLLGDPAAQVRLAALAGVARAAPGSTDARAAAAVVADLVLDDPDLGVRRAAAATLGKLGITDGAVLANLEEAARSSDASLARAARSAASALGRPG